MDRLQNLYEHSVRVPLLMAGPGIRAGQRAGALVHAEIRTRLGAGLERWNELVESSAVQA